jgi:hypothetical protein
MNDMTLKARSSGIKRRGLVRIGKVMKSKNREGFQIMPGD